MYYCRITYARFLAFDIELIWPLMKQVLLMIRFLIVMLLTLGSVFPALAQGMRPFNQVSIVALIITSGDETPVSLSVTHTLESLDAQVLTASAPNASQMRSILKRFAAAAIDVDVALVYYDGAVLKIGDREFVAPGGISLRRPSDLLTKAIPLSALARATALAADGGAVLVHSTGQGVDLISGVTLVETAPNARTGTSPILFASASAAVSLADALESMVETSDDISLSDALSGLSALDGITISQLPVGQAMLRTLPAPETETTQPADDTATAPTDASTADEVTGTTSLPQVGEEPPVADTAADVAAAVEADTAATTDSAAEVAEAGEMADNAETDSATEMASAAESGEAEAMPAEDAELSIDVLRAMQGALSRGQKRTLQLHLRNLGFYRGLIDGIFGPQTARAISAYQESIGANVTGVLTPVQLEALSE